MLNDKIYNETYWEKKSLATLNIAKRLCELTKDIYTNSQFLLKKGSITIRCDGYNQLSGHRRAGNRGLIQFRFGNKKDEILALLDTTNMPYTEKARYFSVILNEKELEEHNEIFRKIAELNCGWWEQYRQLGTSIGMIENIIVI